jgi:hypothetical protein
MNSVVQLTAAERADLFVGASQRLGIGPVALEKDFWVCWTLRELFALPGGEHLIFKGGTSLSKVWRVIERFSEDIDVSLSREWLGFGGENDPERQASRKQQNRKLEELSQACQRMLADKLAPAFRAQAASQLGNVGWQLTAAPDDPQTLLFRYPTALPALADSSYIAREVRIECGARSDAWPADRRLIQPYVADAYPETIKQASVSVQALAIERTFWEKATILHAEAHRPLDKATPTRFSRHYADLAALAVHPLAAQAVADVELRKRVVHHKQVFFPATWARYELAVPGSFRLLPDAHRLDGLAADYRDMRVMYFRPPEAWAEIVAKLQQLEAAINARGA